MTFKNASIEAKRLELASREIDQGFHWRILFVGRSVNGSTDIVSCLSRSLRNLGHHVLDLDLGRHRGMTENPGRAQGGHGPVYLKHAALAGIVERFEPQMIVLCAGGLTFHPAEAEALKQRGIALVGLTLSDPDVFPTVHGHASVFDFHTTNAKVAMPMYADAGVRNTLYFPFGIDRGFVTQQVPDAPDLAADVICIGHATARPERNGVMSRVARDLDVRTYGRGWSLPGSEVVEGRRMVQASRAGKVHVNFPLTRAGYVNIKCGVFESIGSGALVATQRFEEMGDFFSYDDEILGYEDVEDLVVQLRAVLADPERYESMRERAFERLIGGHLYEHRWMALFDEIKAKVFSEDAFLDQARRKRLADTLQHSLPRARNVIVSGFYGANNAGDELILRSISERLRAADPAVRVTVAAENPEQVERAHGLQAFRRKSLDDGLQAARAADAVVLGGGGLWHDYTFERAGGLAGLFQTPQLSVAGFATVPLMARMFDARFHVVGLGIGPLDDPDARRMVRFVAGHADSILVRDQESADIARAVLAQPETLITAPDVVYGLRLPAPAPPAEIAALRGRGYRIVGVNLRPWAGCDREVFLDRIAAALMRCAGRQPLAIVGIPMQAGSTMDPNVLAELCARLGETVPAFVMSAPLTPEELVGALGSLDALVSMRLHACLLAHRLGRCVVGIAYDPKVANHFGEIGRAEQCLRLAFDEDALERALDRALEEGTLPAPTRKLIERLESEAAEALDAAAARVVAAPVRKVIYEVPRAIAAEAAPGATGAAVVGAGRMDGGPVRFADLSYASQGSLSPPTPVANERSVAVWLPTTAPRAGDSVEVQGILHLRGRGDVEIALELQTPYENSKALNRIRFSLQVAKRWSFSEDLASTARPVQLRLFAVAPARIPIRLSLDVTRDCFASEAWSRLSLVKLAISRSMASDHGTRLHLVTSRGALKRITGHPEPAGALGRNRATADQLASRPSNASSVPPARTQQQPARFAEIRYLERGSLSAPPPGSDAARLAVWLPTTQPVAGDAMEVEGLLEVPGDGEVEVALTLLTPYQNSKAARRIRFSLQVADRWSFSEDLAATAQPVKLNLFAVAPAKLRIRLTLEVVADCFASEAWPRTSTVTLAIARTKASGHGRDLDLVASRGEFVRLASPAATPPSADEG